MLIVWICNILILLSVIITLYPNADTYEEIPTSRYVVFATSLLTLCLFAAGVGHHLGFKEGQIKALMGDIRYELVTEIDSTKTWKEIE
jgi:hypothetical protein